MQILVDMSTNSLKILVWIPLPHSCLSVLHFLLHVHFWYRCKVNAQGLCTTVWPLCCIISAWASDLDMLPWKTLTVNTSSDVNQYCRFSLHLLSPTCNPSSCNICLMCPTWIPLISPFSDSYLTCLWLSYLIFLWLLPYLSLTFYLTFHRLLSLLTIKCICCGIQ